MDISLINLSKEIKQTLIEKKLSLACAESCTGGMLSSYITQVSGSSKYFQKGYITYSNDEKIKDLGVNPETIEKFGAVSEQTALEMLSGLDTDIGIAITGVAGPTHSEEKTIGLVYIAIKYLNNYECVKNNFSGKRDEIRFQSVEKAMKMILNSVHNLG